MNSKNITLSINTSFRTQIFFITLILIVIDQFSKHLIRVYMPLHSQIILFPEILALYHTKNTGAAFSLLSGNVEILSIISILAVIFIVYYLFKMCTSLSPLQIIGWSLLLGGTVGNLIDRVIFKSVTDFWELLFINFPIFNMADIFIDLGAIIIIFINLFKNDKHK